MSPKAVNTATYMYRLCRKMPREGWFSPPDGNGNYFPVQGGGQLNGYSDVGNPAPKFQLGWNNGFTYKNFNLNFLLDGKFGGQVISVMQGMLDYYGVSKVSGQARDKGYVSIYGEDQTTNKTVTEIDPKNWYTFIGGRNAHAGTIRLQRNGSPPAGSLTGIQLGRERQCSEKPSPLADRKEPDLLLPESAL
jgi:hypothetical protein